MAEAIRYEETWPEATCEVTTTEPAAGPRLLAARTGEFVRRLQERSQELTERISGEVTARSKGIVREVRQDSQYLKRRAELYHEQRPLQAVGVAAGSAFALGLILGLWRR